MLSVAALLASLVTLSVAEDCLYNGRACLSSLFSSLVPDRVLAAVCVLCRSDNGECKDIAICTQEGKAYVTGLCVTQPEQTQSRSTGTRERERKIFFFASIIFFSFCIENTTFLS
jgi:hypothetical protein